LVLKHFHSASKAVKFISRLLAGMLLAISFSKAWRSIGSSDAPAQRSNHDDITQHWIAQINGNGCGVNYPTFCGQFCKH